MPLGQDLTARNPDGIGRQPLSGAGPGNAGPVLGPEPGPVGAAQEKPPVAGEEPVLGDVERRALMGAGIDETSHLIAPAQHDQIDRAVGARDLEPAGRAVGDLVEAAEFVGCGSHMLRDDRYAVSSA